MLERLNKHFYKIVLLAFVVAVILSFTSISEWRSSDDAFIFFPEDDKVYFQEASTELELLRKDDADEYTLSWTFASETNEPAFLRRDMSLLFANDRFAGARSQSVKEQLFLEEKGMFSAEDTARFDAVTFHHAETHYPDNIFKSTHAWSQDRLYAIDSTLTPLYSFKEPGSFQEEQQKKLMDAVIGQEMEYVLDRLAEEFQVSVDDYYTFTLLDLPEYANIPLPGLTDSETFAVMGKLWEGFYRYYLLGINTFTDDTYSPEGNTLPYILFHKEGNHLLLLYETKDGTPQQLFQLIDKDQEEASTLSTSSD